MRVFLQLLYQRCRVGKNGMANFLGLLAHTLLKHSQYTSRLCNITLKRSVLVLQLLVFLLQCLVCIFQLLHLVMHAIVAFPVPYLCG